MNIADMRRDYLMKPFNEMDAKEDAMEQFHLWFEEAVQAEVPEPNAMTLATASLNGRPSARIVLLKGATSEGFVFFTNYESRKAQEMAVNPQAALVFSWLELARQVRIDGTIQKISKEESENYFYSRPFTSQVSALISPQSKVIQSKEPLESLHQRLVAQYEGGKVPFPENWGGYLLTPNEIEFWQGRASRFHDRLHYLKTDTGWKRERLAP